MLMVISPAKTLDFKTPRVGNHETTPQFVSQASQLIAQLKQLKPGQLRQLMGISDSLATLNVSRYQTWSLEHEIPEARAAMFAFKGDVYRGLAALDFTPEDVEFAQSSLRILSGLYGLLRPLDLIQPYRLEMGTRLKNALGNDLYEYWRNTVTPTVLQAVTDSAPTTEDQVLVNLASDEYFNVLELNELTVPVIKPVFLDNTKGSYRFVSVFGKRARGLMAQWAIKNRVRQPEALKNFDLDGYQFDPQRSTELRWVFTCQRTA